RLGDRRIEHVFVHPRIGLRHPEVAHDREARVEAGLGLQHLVEIDRVLVDVGRRVGHVEQGQQPGRVPGRSARQFVPLQEHRVPAGFRQVVGDAATDGPAAYDKGFDMRFHRPTPRVQIHVLSARAAGFRKGQPDLFGWKNDMRGSRPASRGWLHVEPETKVEDRMARTVVIEAHGGPEVLELVDRPVGEPGPGQIRIRQMAAGLNFIDVYQRSGLYKMTLPAALGMEAAGVVEAVGEGVTHLKPGDRAAYASQPPGAYAEARVMPAAQVCRLPDGIAFDTAAAMMLKGLTVD